MPIDPSIPLSTVGGDPRQLMTLLDLSMKLQANRQAVQAQNQLKEIFSDPSNLEDGMPNSAGLAKIYALDPKYGMEVQRNMLAIHNLKNQDAYKNSQLYGNFREDVMGALKEAVLVKERALARGLPEEAAQAEAQKDYSESYDRLSQAGYSPFMKNERRQFDYNWAKSHVDAYQKPTAVGKTIPEQLYQQYEKDNPQATLAQKEAEYAKITSLGKEDKATPMVGDYTDSAGVEHKNAPMMFEPGKKQFLDVGGKPITPSTLARPGAVKTQTPLAEDQWQAIYAQAATGEPINQIVGFGGAEEKLKADVGAIDFIKKQHPDWSNTQAAQELSKRRTDYLAGRQTITAFDKGPQGNNVRFLNVAVDHLNTARDLVKALASKDIQLINRARVKWLEETGDPAPTNLDTAGPVIGNEIVKAITNTGGAEQDREKAAQTFATYKSEGQLMGGIDTYEKLLAGQMRGLKQQYESSTKRTDFNDKLFPTTIAALNRLGSKGVSGTTGALAAPQVDEVRRGYKFLGGDPADQKNWEKQ